MHAGHGQLVSVAAGLQTRRVLAVSSSTMQESSVSIIPLHDPQLGPLREVALSMLRKGASSLDRSPFFYLHL
jgi:hypothetical protein